MSDIIQLLPDSVANQIAAGEVIQRPASVIKELVENAVDAGASTINVIVVDAGRTIIQVIDDGCGMSETDARLAFERHATSKIKKADDLFSLKTMGFRGEALASIAAVAQIELKTRRKGEELGTHLYISASRINNQEPCSCPVGSNFKVENLFFNVPARRKFLKSNTTELNNILTSFQRIALVYPEINFTFHSNDLELFNLKSTHIHQRILDVFGKRINQDLLSVNVDTTVCKISGFVGKPESARKKVPHQYFFVNGRYMKHPYFHKAVMSAFERLIPTGEQVPYFIYFNLPPEDIDVNIHPVKTEIKFENEQAIWQILLAAVKEAVGLFSGVTSLDFDVHGKPEIPVFDEKKQLNSPKVQYNPSYNPFKQNISRQSTKAEDWTVLYDGITTPPDKELSVFPEPENFSQQSIVDEKSPVHYQYKEKYIMTAVKSGLMVIDQHRAHVRILYEDYMERIANHHGVSQKMLFPEIVHLSPSENAMFESVLTELSDIGFELTSLGADSYAVNSIPSGLDGLNVVDLIHDMLSTAIEQGEGIMEEINSSLALGLARSVAIPYGQVLNNDEMDKIVNGLFACSNMNYTPNGKKILCIVDQHEFEHLLG